MTASPKGAPAGAGRGSLRQAAAAWVFDDRGRVLLIRENYGRHRYGPPGGAVEPGESPLEAVLREVREEVCTVFEAEALVGVYHFVYAEGRRPPWLGFAFAGRLDGEPRLPGTVEIAEVGWFDPDALPNPITNITRVGLADARAVRRGVFRRVALE